MEEHLAIARLKQGDIEALEPLVRAYQVQAVRTAYLIVRDRALAEDLVQAAFLRAYERISLFDDSRPFAPWFLRIVLNDALKAARRSGRSVSLAASMSEAETTIGDLLTAATPAPDLLAENAELRQAVWDALGQLSAEQRTAIVQRYYLGMSEAEMSDREQCPPGTIKWRLHKAKQRLRSLLRPWHQADIEAPGQTAYSVEQET